MGAFPSPHRPRVLWIGLEGDLERLEGLQLAVERALARRGFPKEGRAFSPHLTLGRVRETATPAQRQELAKLLECPPGLEALEIRAETVHLMKSELLREGARYTSLYQVELADRAT
jgi:2'-5' RNA ligase